MPLFMVLASALSGQGTYVHAHLACEIGVELTSGSVVTNDSPWQKDVIWEITCQCSALARALQPFAALYHPLAQNPLTAHPFSERAFEGGGRATPDLNRSPKHCSSIPRNSSFLNFFSLEIRSCAADAHQPGLHAANIRLSCKILTRRIHI